MNYLTYFTSRTKEELDSIIIDLYSVLMPSYSGVDRLAKKIVNIFLNDFDPDDFYAKYGIDVSNGFITSLYKTLRYDIDTDAFIGYIYNKISQLLR